MLGGENQRAAIAGDALCYDRFLKAVTPYLRSIARRRCDQFGAPPSEVEDVVQEVLLAVHLKRGTWDISRPIGPLAEKSSMTRSLRSTGAPKVRKVAATLRSCARETGERMCHSTNRSPPRRHKRAAAAEKGSCAASKNGNMMK